MTSMPNPAASEFTRPLVRILLSISVCAFSTSLLRADTPVEDCSEDALLLALTEASATNRIVFTEDCDFSVSEPIAIESDDVTIDAQGHTVRISGDNLTHIFDVAEAVNNITLIGLTLVTGQDTN